MTHPQNRLARFWEELKRRNVIRVITVYAGAAFVIIELFSNISEPLRLPEWTTTLVIVLLAIGFPVIIFFSWVYDFHPKGGLTRTKPAEKVRTEGKTGPSNGWRIASIISFVVIIGLIVLNVISRSTGGKTEKGVEGKSIAVIPFKSLSNDKELQYQADGVMDAILQHLSQIKDLRVMPRTSVEKYRNTQKTIPEICRELDVSYILEGSFQKSGDRIRLFVELVQFGRKGSVWTHNYVREWKDIFAVQSEVAQLVAGELQAVITPEEIQRINTIPTASLTATSLTADDFFKMGKTQLSLYLMDKSNREALTSAEKNFNKALQYDSTYALAYSGLGIIYSEKLNPSYLSDNILDTILIFANKALQYDPQLSEAYDLRGIFYSYGNPDRAIREFDRAIDYNPNDWRAYSGKANVYNNEELLLAIKNGKKAVSLRGGGAELPDLYRDLGDQFYIAGFPEKASECYADAVELDGDSSLYYNSLASIEFNVSNFEKEIQYAEKAYSFDTLDTNTLLEIFEGYQWLGLFEESFVYCKKYIRICRSMGGMTWLAHRVGYDFDHMGNHDSAEFFFKLQINTSNNTIGNGEGTSVYFSYYDRACVYAYQGEVEEAMEDLRKFNKMKKIPQWMVSLIKVDPMLDSLRQEPEFQQIVSDMETKYLAEHERVRQWLEENDLI